MSPLATHASAAVARFVFYGRKVIDTLLPRPNIHFEMSANVNDIRLLRLTVEPIAPPA